MAIVLLALGVAAALAEWQDKPIDPFFNVNTPEDTATTERLAAAQSAR